MKKLFPLTTLTLFCAGLFSQAPAVQWQKCYGGPGNEGGYAICRTTDMGYIFAGLTDSIGGQVTSLHGEDDAWVVKTDSNGVLQWQKSYGGTGVDEVEAMQATRDGGFIMGCNSNSGNGDETTNHGQQDYWLVKIDVNGNIQWQKSYGGPAADLIQSVEQTKDGGYIMCGNTWGEGGDVTGIHGLTDYWVVKVDSLGNLTWAKCLGGSGYDFGYCARQTPDGGYIVNGNVGSNDGQVTGNYGFTNPWIVKLDANGNITWQHCYGGTADDAGFGVEPTKDGGYIVSAGVSSTNVWVKNHHPGTYYNEDAWILKLNSAGDIVWQRALGGANNDILREVHQTLEGGYIAVGYTDSYDGDVKDAVTTTGHDEAWIVKMDAGGNIEWEKALAGLDTNIHDVTDGNSVFQNADSSFAVVCLTTANDGDISGNHGKQDIAVFKLAKSPPPCLQFTFNNNNFDCTRLLDTTTIIFTSGVADSIWWGDGTSSAGPGFTTSHVYAQPGIYNLTITNAAGCFKTAQDTLVNYGITIDSTLFINPSCDYHTLGQITVSASGGVAPYSYLWSNGATTTTLSNLDAGWYAVSVTDPTGCLSVMRYNLFKSTDEPGYYVHAFGNNPNCANNGSVYAVVHNGIAPFAYLWSDGGSTQLVNNLGTGLYTLTVTDSLGCKVTGITSLQEYCYNLIMGTVFDDVNSNCVQDSAEGAVHNVTVTATDNSGNTYYAYAGFLDGNYAIYVPDTGAYTISASMNLYAPCGEVQYCGQNSTVHFSALGDTSFNNNYGVHFNGYDLGMSVSWGTVPPCYTHGDWEKWYFLSYQNASIIPIPGPITLTFKYDSALAYIAYASAPYASYDVANRTLTYKLDSVGTLGDLKYFGDMEFTYRIFDPGYQLRAEFWITPVDGDCDSTDNHYIFIDSIFDSRDPNDKSVEPANTTSPDDSILTYTINFQNTGNDTAWFITVLDTLSPNLDPKTVRTIATSLKLTSFNISGPGVLAWSFDPAALPDSFVNPSTSKGFIKFQVMKKKNLPLGTIINNQAAIYFDYNPAVFTNTVSDTVALPLAVPVVKAAAAVSVNAYPNPFSNETNIVITGLNDKYDFELYDLTGRPVKKIPSLTTNTLRLNRNELSSGIYLYGIRVEGQTVAFGKLVVE